MNGFKNILMLSAVLTFGLSFVVYAEETESAVFLRQKIR